MNNSSLDKFIVFFAGAFVATLFCTFFEYAAEQLLLYGFLIILASLSRYTQHLQDRQCDCLKNQMAAALQNPWGVDEKKTIEEGNDGLD